MDAEDESLAPLHNSPGTVCSISYDYGCPKTPEWWRSTAFSPSSDVSVLTQDLKVGASLFADALALIKPAGVLPRITLDTFSFKFRRISVIPCHLRCPNDVIPNNQRYLKTFGSTSNVKFISVWCRIYATVNWVIIGSGNDLSPRDHLNQCCLIIN